MWEGPVAEQLQVADIAFCCSSEDNVGAADEILELRIYEAQLEPGALRAIIDRDSPYGTGRPGVG